MKPGMICCLALVAVFGGGCSLVGQSDKRVVTDVNANRPLGTIGAEQLGANLVMVVPWGQYLPLDKDATPSETISIVRDQDIEARGRLYCFMKDDTGAGHVQLGVFSDHKSALAIFEAHLKHTSVGPDENLTAELGTKAVAWSVREEGQHLAQVLFVRDNVVVRIDIPAPGFAESGGSTRVITKLASTIDCALVNGALGVQRGTTLKVPQIVAVDPLNSVPAHSKVTAKAHISVPENPQDRDSKYVELVRDLAFYPRGVGVPYHITYITPGCVVASKVVTMHVRRDATASR
jgi:hypothetical protein